MYTDCGEPILLLRFGFPTGAFLRPLTEAQYMVTVRAPATSANLGSGFDVFGVALERPADVVHVEPAETTTIEVTGVGSQYIPTAPADNVVGAVAETIEAPAAITIDKGVRPASGLGSSAASAAGAAVALNELYDLGYSRRELIPIAAEGEALVSGVAHTDNVTPALLGGFTIAGRERPTRIDASIPLVVCLPDLAVATREARAVVPETATIGQLTTTVRNAATVVAGACGGEPALFGRGMRDPLVTPARGRLIDGYDAVCAAAREAGAAGVAVSGAGPAVLAVCAADMRQSVAAAMVAAFDEAGIESRTYQTAIGSRASILDR